MSDELIEMAEVEIQQAVDELNTVGEHLTPDGRLQLAKIYALTSIARSLDRIANEQPGAFSADHAPALRMYEAP